MPKVLAGIVLVMMVSLSGAAANAPAENMTIREEKFVTINGVREVWQLVWIGETKPVCGAETLDDVETADTCPCAGAVYGEVGHLWLVRKRHGREVERMNLEPLFGGHNADNPGAFGQSYLQRHAARDGDSAAAVRGDKSIIAQIRSRPVVPVMKFADYNHDGRASEFLLQVGTYPCAKRVFAAIGVSADNGKLHAFASAEEPETPLITFIGPWEALQKGGKPTSMTVWPCGDHGSEVQNDVTVSAKGGRIHHVMEDRACVGQ